VIIRLIQKNTNKAVYASIGAKIYMSAIGYVISILVASIFSQKLQGIYYLFASAQSFLIIAEMGMGGIITIFVSHEFGWLSSLGNDLKKRATASRRFNAIARFGICWYLYLGTIVSFFLYIIGFYILQSKDADLFEWKWPWALMCMGLCLNLYTAPYLAILEGSGRQLKVYRVRLLALIVSTTIGVIAILAGLGLWAITITTLINFMVAAGCIYAEIKNIYIDIGDYKGCNTNFSWVKEMLPMQWRISISFLSGYFAYNFAVPVAFSIHGAIEAGKLGMTMVFVNGVIGLTNSYLNPKMVKFGVYISRKKVGFLRRKAKKLSMQAAFIGLMLSICMILFIEITSKTNLNLQGRMFSTLSILFYLIGVIFIVASMPFSAFLRSRKQEPLMKISILNGSLTALYSIYFINYWSENLLGICFAVVNGLCAILILRKFNKKIEYE